MDGSLRVTEEMKLGDVGSPGLEAPPHEKGLRGLRQEEPLGRVRERNVYPPNSGTPLYLVD